MPPIAPIATTSHSDLKVLNRRARVRYRCNPPNAGRAFFANSSKSVDALVVDLSEGGIGLVLDRHLEPGTLVRVEMGSGGRETCVDLAAHVSNTAQLDKCSWRCGCEWVHSLTAAELQAMR